MNYFSLILHTLSTTIITFFIIHHNYYHLGIFWTSFLFFYFLNILNVNNNLKN